jgi:hypothetical protein
MPARHHLTKEYEMGLAEEMLARSYALGSNPRFRRFVLEVFRSIDRSDFDDFALALWEAAEAGRLVRTAEAREALAALVVRIFRVDSELTDVFAGSDTEPFVVGLLRLAELAEGWVRPVDDWMPPTGDAADHFGSLARYLLALYPVPGWMDALLLSRTQPLGAGWFRHVGAGGNLRAAPGLPVPLTKRMAHFALEAPAGLTFVRAIRRGQILGLDGSEELAREINRSWLGRELGTPDAEAWWTTVFRWLVAQTELDPVQVAPVLDYLRHRKARDPRLEMKGRGLRPVLQGMEAWHRELRRQRQERKRQATAPQQDPRFGSAGLRRGLWRFKQVTWVMEEILTPQRLREEGSEQTHCVASYEGVVRAGRTSIWSLGMNCGSGFIKRALTVEVENGSRTIVQARGKCNRMPELAELRILGLWAHENALRLDLE